MDATMALLLVGGGAVAVWILTSPAGQAFLGGSTPGTLAGGSAVPLNSAGRPFLTSDQVNYYLSGFAKHLTDAQAAAVGAQAGAPIAGLTFGISVGIGALVGYLGAHNSNDTLEDRKVFAERLGFKYSVSGGGAYAQAPATSTTDYSHGLLSYLLVTGYEGLVERAMHVIGRKDFEGDASWMLDVLVALWQSNYPFPK